jgi:hypothetical protein
MMPHLQIISWFDLTSLCKNIFAHYNIQIVYDNMRLSVLKRLFVLVLFGVTLQIFLYFANQGHIPDYIVYILFASFSIPMFLFVYLGNGND